MGKINFCTKCGSNDLKQNGTQYICNSCKHTFGDASAPSVSPVIGYVGAMFGNPTPPPPPSGTTFSAPPQTLLDSIQANAERQRQAAENAARAEREASSRRNSSGRSGSGNGHSTGASNGRNGNNVTTNTNTSSSSSNSSSSDSGSSRTGGASDSENTLRFLDNVNMMNDLSYQLVNGNANTWANIARDKGIINSKQHTEIKYMVATRNCIAHGSGDSVRITAELVNNAKEYCELIKRTSSQIR